MSTGNNTHSGVPTGSQTVPAFATRQDILRECRFLADMPREAQKLLTAAGRVRTYRRRQVIVRQGDPMPGIAYTVRGVTRLWLIDATDREYTVEFGWSGAISLVTLGGPVSELPWNATAVVPSTLLMIPWDAIAAVRRRYSIDHAIMAYAAEEYRRRHIWHGMLRSVRLRPRLLLILRRMGEEFGRQTEQGVFVDFPVTQTDLAELAYVTRDEVGRVMREFAADGLVRPIGRRGLVIPDPDRLGPAIRLG